MDSTAAWQCKYSKAEDDLLLIVEYVTFAKPSISAMKFR